MEDLAIGPEILGEIYFYFKYFCNFIITSEYMEFFCALHIRSEILGYFKLHGLSKAQGL